MNCRRPVFLAAMTLLISTDLWAATACKNPYEKVFPYDIPLGNAQANVLVRNEVRLSYDCKSALARAASEAKAGFFNKSWDLILAEAQATAQENLPATAGARVLVLGTEVARRDLNLSKPLSLEYSPEPELDQSGSMSINVGPVPVPIKYGFMGNASMRITGGTKGFGVVLDLVPNVVSKAYVQAGVDVSVAQAIARGDVSLLKDTLKNSLSLSFENSDRKYIRFDANSRNTLQALDGYVYIRAQAGVGPLVKNYERDILRWDGIAKDNVLFNHTERVAILK